VTGVPWINVIKMISKMMVGLGLNPDWQLYELDFVTQQVAQTRGFRRLFLFFWHVGIVQTTMVFSSNIEICNNVRVYILGIVLMKDSNMDGFEWRHCMHGLYYLHFMIMTIKLIQSTVILKENLIWPDWIEIMIRWIWYEWSLSHSIEWTASCRKTQNFRKHWKCPEQTRSVRIIFYQNQIHVLVLTLLVLHMKFLYLIYKPRTSSRKNQFFIGISFTYQSFIKENRSQSSTKSRSR
jgi:hypothetical protein